MKSAQTKKILLIAMANSVHTSRWIEMFSGENLEIVLFPSTPTRTIHPTIKKKMQDGGSLTVAIPFGMKWLAFPLGLIDYFFLNRIRSSILRKIIKEQHDEFDVIHAMEIQHAGYLLSSALNRLPPQRKVIVSNWGSDIYWFRKYERHRKKISSLLKVSTHYACECERDVLLARELGFTGEVLPIHPNTGPMKDSAISLGEKSPAPSSRQIILIKGYTGFVGRADIALEALQNIAECVRSFEVVVYSSDHKSRQIARKIARGTGLKITCLKKHSKSHDEMLDLFRQARLYVGISESDGISTSLLDAISSGTFPIQTNTSCASEWIQDSVSGFLVDFQDVSDISHKILKALTDDSLVNNASRINLATSKERLSSAFVLNDLLSFY